MRVLCVALWRKRPSVLFVLQARFSPPIDKTPCFNANPHRQSSPYAATSPPPSPPSPLSLLYSVIARDIERGYLDGGYRGRLLKNRCLHQSYFQRYFIPRARGGRFFRLGVSRTLDRSISPPSLPPPPLTRPETTGNQRPSR